MIAAAIKSGFTSCLDNKCCSLIGHSIAECSMYLLNFVIFFLFASSSPPPLPHTLTLPRMHHSTLHTPHPTLPSTHPSHPHTSSQVQHAEKQRQFEEAMMAGVSDERKEAIWQSAQQKAVREIPLIMFTDTPSYPHPSPPHVSHPRIHTLTLTPSNRSLTSIPSHPHILTSSEAQTHTLTPSYPPTVCRFVVSRIRDL